MTWWIIIILVLWAILGTYIPYLVKNIYGLTQTKSIALILISGPAVWILWLIAAVVIYRKKKRYERQTSKINKKSS